MSEIVEKIQKECVKTLAGMVTQTIANVERSVVDQIGDFKSLSQQSGAVVERFVAQMNNHFDELLDKEVIKDDAIFSFETLSLVQEEELDVMVALEGMVNASRNQHLPVFISFNTRLSSLFPRKKIDESSNPLDPEQVATAFQEALRPLGLDPQNSLTVYRAFNTEVLKQIDTVLNQGNKILIESSVIPSLGMEAARRQQQSKSRTKPRTEISTFGTIEEEVFDEAEERPELFSIMQNLLHSDDKPRAPKPSASSGGDDNTVEAIGDGADEPEFMIPTGMIPNAPADGTPAASSGSAKPAAMQAFKPQEGQTVQMVDQIKLMEILTNIQERLNATPSSGPGHIPATMEEVDKLDISQSLGEILQSSSSDEGVVSAVDRQSSDIINLVTLLYEAIWQDPSVPIPIKELIGRTQITIIKVALEDVNFFNNENHPARAILNEFASAGIGWTEVEKLEEDPLYQKIRELVDRILSSYTGDMALFSALIKDFRNFKARESAKTKQLEQNILKASERKERMDDIYELVSQKIEERILGRELDPFVDDLLNSTFHKFMVMLVIKEGPGSNAWKQAINTIDVLLWTVEPKEQREDRQRLETVRPRLFNNLKKAFKISNVPAEEIDKILENLTHVQEESFPKELRAGAEKAAKQKKSIETAESEEKKPDSKGEKVVRFLAAGGYEEEQAQDKVARDKKSASDAETATEDNDENEEELPDDNPYMLQVDELSVGMWLQFVGDTEETSTRCKLAAKINAIDKFIFVNRQGVKVLEKTKMGLARELHDGTVNIISDGLLFSRALESVIGNLRDHQIEQQTGGAYQPDKETGIS